MTPLTECYAAELTDVVKHSMTPLEEGLRNLLAYDGETEYGIQVLVPGGEVNIIRSRLPDGSMLFDAQYQEVIP